MRQHMLYAVRHSVHEHPRLPCVHFAHLSGSAEAVASEVVCMASSCICSPCLASLSWSSSQSFLSASACSSTCCRRSSCVLVAFSLKNFCADSITPIIPSSTHAVKLLRCRTSRFALLQLTSAYKVVPQLLTLLLALAQLFFQLAESLPHADPIIDFLIYRCRSKMP